MVWMRFAAARLLRFSGPRSSGADRSSRRVSRSSNPFPSGRASTNFRSLSDGRSTTNAVARSSSSRTGAARGRPRRPCSWSGAVGGPQLSGDRRSQRGARARDNLGTAMLHSPSGRGLASGTSRSPFCRTSVARLASTTLPANINNLRLPWGAV